MLNGQIFAQKVQNSSNYGKYSLYFFFFFKMSNQIFDFDSSSSSEQVPKKPNRLSKKVSKSYADISKNNRKIADLIDEHVRGNKGSQNYSDSDSETKEKSKLIAFGDEEEEEKNEKILNQQKPKETPKLSKSKSSKFDYSDENLSPTQIKPSSGKKKTDFDQKKHKTPDVTLHPKKYSRNEIYTHNTKANRNSIEKSLDFNRRFKTIGGDMNNFSRGSQRSDKSGKSENSSTFEENFDYEKQMSIVSNSQQDWSFPMDYVPPPGDMEQIIEDYHAKYSTDYLLKRIMNNPAPKSENHE